MLLTSKNPDLENRDVKGVKLAQIGNHRDIDYVWRNFEASSIKTDKLAFSVKNSILGVVKFSKNFKVLRQCFRDPQDSTDTKNMVENHSGPKLFDIIISIKFN